MQGWSWWCSANGIPWTWHWIRYPGVWALVAITAFLYHRLSKNAPRRDKILGWLGVLTLWIALDWPLGPLAAGYLASAHALQFLMVALVAPPLILRGIRTSVKRSPIIVFLTRPLLAAVIFNIIVVATHVPRVVDTWMVSQTGAFVLDAAWLLAGLIFWWPITVPVPERPNFTPPLQMLYLFLGTLFHTGIAMVMLIAEHPLYGVYELAPPMTGLSAYDDLKVAGGIMELVGLAIIFSVISVIFFRWMPREDRG